jgi:NTE family protein
VTRPKKPLIGVTLAGAGARGAYEAGVLSVLLPAMEEYDERPTVWIGTSAGAINAALFASVGHLPAKEAVDVALSKWRQVHRGHVFRSPLTSGVRMGAQYLAEVAGTRARLDSLLDTTPLRRTVDEWMDWKQLHLNTRTANGPIDAVGVSATAFGVYRTAMFVEGRLASTMPASDEERGVDYRATSLRSDHILASAAIPVAFPPVWVDDEVGKSGGWYLDGGVRLNAPLKPAIALGVDKLVVVATAPARSSHVPMPPDRKIRPDVFDAAGDLLHAGLVDRMIEDLRTLGNFNEVAAPNGKANGSKKARRTRRVIPYMFAGPAQDGEIAALASAAFNNRYGRGPLSGFGFNVRILNRLLGGSPASRGELFSHLFFEPEFVDAAIALGASDAWRLLDTARGELPWRTGTL